MSSFYLPIILLTLLRCHRNIAEPLWDLGEWTNEEQEGVNRLLMTLPPLLLLGPDLLARPRCKGQWTSDHWIVNGGLQGKSFNLEQPNDFDLLPTIWLILSCSASFKIYVDSRPILSSFQPPIVLLTNQISQRYHRAIA